VIDDWAMAPLSEPERRDFWEICENRYQVRSTILTSQLPVSRWHEQIGDPVIRLFFDRLRIRDEGRFDAQESPKGELVSLGQQSGGAVDQQFATLRELLPFYGALGKSRRTPSWLVFRSETIPSASVKSCSPHIL